MILSCWPLQNFCQPLMNVLFAEALILQLSLRGALEVWFMEYFGKIECLIVDIDYPHKRAPIFSSTCHFGGNSNLDVDGVN